MDHQEKIRDLYIHYNTVIRPLISDVEIRFEQFPAPLFNEIRAFNDHIARYYSNAEVNEITKAESHLTRITLDCFKYINVNIYDIIKNFEKRTKHIDLSVINNGEFFPKYKRLYREAQNLIRQAKKSETLGLERSAILNQYQDAYNKYFEIEEEIYNIETDVNRTRVRYYKNGVLKVLLFILAAAISGIISVVIGCDSISIFLKSIFTGIYNLLY